MFKEAVMQVLHLVALALNGSNAVVLGRVVFEVVQFPGENEKLFPYLSGGIDQTL